MAHTVCRIELGKKYRFFSKKTGNTGAPVRFEPQDFQLAKWVISSDGGKTDEVDLDTVKKCVDSRSSLVFDRFERPVLLLANQFTLNFFRDRHPDIVLVDATEI